MNPNQAFKLKLKEGAAEEYKRRHDNIWPEMQSMFAEKGISDYSIFLDTDGFTLFAVRKVSGGVAPLENDHHAEVLQRWWDYMADLMETNPDNSPIVEKLDSVFYFR